MTTSLRFAAAVAVVPWVSAARAPARPRGPTPAADEAMARYARGEDRAFRDVYDFVAPRVSAYLRRRLRDQSRVADLAQQTFLHMHRARHTFAPGAEVLPWAFAIARRQLVDAYRAAERDAQVEGGDDGAAHADANGEELIAAREAARRVQVALAGLSRPQRDAFDLVKGDGLSLADAAAVLGTTVMGVKLRTHRAYAALRLALAAPATASSRSD